MRAAVLLLLRIVHPVIRHRRHQPQGRTSISIAAVNWADDQRRVRQGETVVEDHVVVPIIMQTIVNVVPIAGMIIILGDSDGDGGGGNDGRGGDAVSDAAATLTAAQSAVDGGPDGDDGSAAIAMQ